MTQASATPRTDALIDKLQSNKGHDDFYTASLAEFTDFSRQLETALTAAEEKIAGLEDRIKYHESERENLILAANNNLERADRLRAELSKYESAGMPKEARPLEFHSAGYFHPDAVVCSAKVAEALMRDYDALRQFAAKTAVDAERYRYARDNLFIGYVYQDEVTPMDDEQIDAARSAQKVG
jgi:hypothetical protein